MVQPTQNDLPLQNQGQSCDLCQSHGAPEHFTLDNVHSPTTTSPSTMTVQVPSRTPSHFVHLSPTAPQDPHEISNNPFYDLFHPDQTPTHAAEGSPANPHLVLPIEVPPMEAFESHDQAVVRKSVHFDMVPQELHTDSDDSQSIDGIYTNTYTDTISSVDSSTYLIDPADREDSIQSNYLEESQPTNEENGNDFYLNGAYTSSSSCETLDENINEEMKSLLKPQEEENTSCKTLSGNDERHTDEEVIPIIEDFVHHHLSPIAEGEIASFVIKEIDPSEMSFKKPSEGYLLDQALLNSQSSLPDYDNNYKRGMRACTMQNLHERNSFLNLTEISKVGRACQKALVFLRDDVTFGSIISLTDKSKGNGEAFGSFNLLPSLGKSNVDIVKSGKHMKNLLWVSLCVTLVFIAVGSVRNLQSSLNHEGGVGVISLAVCFTGFMFGSLFSSFVVSNYQPVKCLIINIIPQLLYVAANMYPVLWIMVPASALQGVSMAVLWNALSTYITYLAKGRSWKKGDEYAEVSGKFFGIFCLLFQSNLIVGNLIASLVLMFGNTGQSSSPASGIDNSSLGLSPQGVVSPLNDSDASFISLAVVSNFTSSQSQIENATLKDVTHLHLCGANFCHHFELSGGGVVVGDSTKYLLFGIYMGCILVALVISIFLIEPLNSNLYTKSTNTCQLMKKHFVSLAKFSVNFKFLLLLPILMYSTIQFGYISAEVTKAFITCPIGIHMVGYAMICLGVCGSVSSFLSGLFTRVVGRIPQIIFGKF